MKRKGQFLSLLTVFTLAFIGSGHIFTEIAQGSMITGEADRAVGDPEMIAESQVYTDVYTERLPLMVNYSAINASRSIADDHGDIDLSDGVPEDNDIYNDLIDLANDNLVVRNRINNFECERIVPPELEIQDIDSGNITVDISDSHVVCESSKLDVNIDHGLGSNFNVSYDVSEYEDIYPDDD